ncbi:ras-related protein Rab-2A-like [Amphiura filiformis]|uniref:ras-related protein Rab-2A-like n=1 Tax=Amphiura filiformis TaxID=82378 RepID=UPI003B21C74D
MANEPSTENIPTYKVILLGEVDAGKTTLFYHIRDRRYVPSESYGPGVDYITKAITVDNDAIQLVIWDTAGVERFRTLTRNYFRGACAVLFAFSTANKNSLLNLVQFVEDTVDSAPDALRYLIGCKCDMPSDQDFSEQDAHNFAQAHGCRKIFMTSAKMGRFVPSTDRNRIRSIGVEEAIHEIAHEIHTLHKTKRRRETQELTHEHHGFYTTSDEQNKTDACSC